MDTHTVCANEMLYDAYFYGAAWQSQLIDKAPGIEDTHQSPASQALDSAESPHIVYQDSASHVLRYAHGTGDAWQIETVDNSARLGEDNSLSLDGHGRANISYYDRNIGGLMYAYWNSVTWEINDLNNAWGVD